MTEAEVFSNAEGLAYWVCRRYRGRQDYDDLLQIARIGLLRGIRKHDESRGELASFMITCARSESSRYFMGQARKRRRCPGPLLSLDEPLNDDDELTLADAIKDTREDPEEKAIADIQNHAADLAMQATREIVVKTMDDKASGNLIDQAIKSASKYLQ